MSSSVIGKVVGEYCVTEYVGSGNMGDVYKAQDAANGATVAIKLIPEHLLANDTAKRQFLRGSQALAALDHPHICPFHRAGETPEGRAYLVMSFCEGDTLQATIARGRCDMRATLELVRDVADGLAHAHKRNVVHRDIKPANLMFGDNGTVKIVDFGLAKLGDASASSTGLRPGTLLYMSPEQLNGDPVDGRADVFALGVVLYEMLTGTHPFHAERTETVIFRICNDYPRPLADVLPEVPPAVQEIVDRALRKDPHARYQSAGEMRDNLQAALDGDELKAQKRPRSKRPWAIAGIAVAAAAVAALLLVPRDRVPVGIAVVSSDDAGSPDELALARGLAHDLSDRARFFARDHRGTWVATPDRLIYFDSRKPEDIHQFIGASLVVTVHAPTDDRSGYELQGYALASAPVLHTRRAIVFDSPQFNDSLDASTKSLLGVKSRKASPGYTQDTGAYRAYLTGLGYLDTKSPQADRAIALFESAVAADSSFVRAWAALGETCRQRGVSTKDAAWFERAESACHRALAIDSRQPEALVTMGQMQAARKQPAEAIKSYRAALHADERNTFANWRLAEVHIAAADTGDAIAAYTAAVRANPDDPRPLEMLGFYLYRFGDYRDAIAPLERVSRLIPTSGPNYNILGACYFAIDCWDEATAMFEKSFDLERTYQACTNLGTLYYMNHMFEDAARMYEWALEYNRADYTVVGALGAAQYWIAGKREQGIESYREAARLAEEALHSGGESAPLLAELSGYYAVIGHDSTIAVAERAVHIEPGNSDVLFRVAMTYEHLGRRPKALAMLRAAIQRGFSLRHVENEPFLAELRKDIRYDHIVSGWKREPWCRI